MQREQTAAAPAPVAPAPEIAEHDPAIKEGKAKRLYMIIGIAALAILILYGVYALMTSGKETTDDAQVAADVVPVAARIAGQVVNVYIHENQQVHRGDILAETDPSAAAVSEAQAAITRAQANAEKARLDFARAQELGGKGDISKAQVDAARAANETAQADSAQARARLRAAENQQQAAQ